MNIAICDDDKIIVKQIEKFLFDFFIEKGIDYELYTFTSGRELLEREVQFDIAFIDIEMPGINGIELSKRLLEKNSYAIIMIVTSFNHYLDDAMELSVYRYISKPVDRERFMVNLGSALRKYLNINRPIAIKGNDEISKVNSCDIIYLSFEDRKVWIHTRDDVIEVTKTLDYWKNQLGDANFYQINRSHIVNLGYVTSVNKNKVVLKCNGEIIELKASSRIYASLKRAYYSFLGGTSE